MDWSACFDGWSIPVQDRQRSHQSVKQARHGRRLVPSGSTTAPARAATQTMRAAIIAGPKQTEIEHFTLPEPGPGEVRIRLEGCGVCGSNLPLWEGRPWFQYPAAPGSPGHEGWGVVDALGQGVTGL